MLLESQTLQELVSGCTCGNPPRPPPTPPGRETSNAMGKATVGSSAQRGTFHMLKKALLSISGVIGIVFGLPMQEELATTSFPVIPSGTSPEGHMRRASLEGSSFPSLL